MNEKNIKKILVTGASGYVGSRLVSLLLKKKYKVRAASRNKQKLSTFSWANDPDLEIVELDASNRESLENACKGCDCVYYFIHSMDETSSDFAETDRIAANNMVFASESALVKRIIYLGGLGNENLHLSEHLSSRREVEEILKNSQTPVTIFRSAMIVGSGSTSFEILRYLVERLPVMITPRWVQTESQPIAINDVLQYLIQCLEKEETIGQTFDIGGPEILSYRNLMKIYAEEAKIWKRLIIPVPVLTPRLSSYWVHFITPIKSSVARPLADGLRNRLVCKNNRIKEIIPLKLSDLRTTIGEAYNTRQHIPLSDSDNVLPSTWKHSGDKIWAGGTVLRDHRELNTNVKKEHIWETISSIGGKNGWFYGNFLWKLRGFLDEIFGGYGLSRGRKEYSTIKTGDIIDCWIVEDVKIGERLLLKAEMKLPGIAWLEFRLKNNEKNNSTLITQTAHFIPRGLSGILYWYSVYIIHQFIFRGMILKIVKKSKDIG